jgi:hypothetical protein
MRGVPIIIGADQNSPPEERMFEDEVPTLLFLEHAVSREGEQAYIEPVPYFDEIDTKDGSRPCVAYCNENGLVRIESAASWSTSSQARESANRRHAPAPNCVRR